VQDLEDMTAKLGQFIRREHAMVRQRHFPRHRRYRDGGATRQDRDECDAVACEANDLEEASGLNGFGQGHRWQEGGESTRQRERRIQGFKSPGYTRQLLPALN
jgi:hypothetical protein